MTQAARAALALLLILAGCDRSPPPPPKTKPVRAAAPMASGIVAEPLPTGGPPEPPARLPPVRTCLDAMKEPHLERLPGQVNGALIRGAEGLRRLRRDWGDALIIVRSGNFAGADLRRARLHNICFAGTNLTGSDWRGVQAPGVGFEAADLTKADLRGASMPGVGFADPLLDGADASGADWSGGRVAGGSMGGWDGLRLDGARLRGFRFDCSEAAGALCVGDRGKVSFRRADLTGASLDGFWGNADWTGARFDRTRVNLYKLLEIGTARIAGPLIVTEERHSARLAPRQYAAIRPVLRDPQFSSETPPRLGKRPLGLRPGTMALYAASPIAILPAGRSSAAYRRLLPVLTAGAVSRLVVRVGRDGRIDAIGDATGGARHMCGLSARRLRFDPKTGWYTGLTRPPSGDSTGWRSRRLPVLRFGRGMAEVRDGGHGEDPDSDSFVSCGARAGFYAMELLPLPAAEAMKIMSGGSFDHELADRGLY